MRATLESARMLDGTGKEWFRATLKNIMSAIKLARLCTCHLYSSMACADLGCIGIICHQAAQHTRACTSMGRACSPHVVSRFGGSLSATAGGLAAGGAGWLLIGGSAATGAVPTRPGAAPDSMS